MNQRELTKFDIVAHAEEFGAEFVGFAPVSRWEEYKDVPEEQYPQKLWSEAQTVIVLAVPLWLPFIEAAPSVLGREQAIVTSDLLEEMAYRLALFLSDNGYAAINVPSGSRGEAIASPVFSHIWAGFYAGLGTIGWNNTLLTKEYGPRVHLVSVFTELKIAGDLLLREPLCQKCLHCQKICPAKALHNDDQIHAQLDYKACLQHEQRLQRAFANPCGACLKVCPVGEDRELFGSNNFEKYFTEQAILDQNPQAKEYQDWVHIRSYGSYPLDETTKK